MSVRAIPKLLLMIVVAAGLSLIGTVAAQSGDKVLRVSISGPMITFDPANYRSRINENVIRNMFDALYTINTAGEHVPEIAESLTQVDDTVWEFKIREGIRFHNGDPLTAADVAFSYNRVAVEGAMDGETSPRQPLMYGLQFVEEIDEYTVRFHYDTVVPELRVLTGAVLMQVMPKDYFEEVGIDGFLANPVGAGPFKFREADFAERIVLDRFDDYWGGAPGLLGEPGPAPADRLIFEVVPDPTSRLAALRAGDLDVIQAVLPDQLPVVESDPNVVLKTAPGTVLVFLAFTTTREPFDDPAVRRAIAYAIDYDLLVDAAFAGAADPLNGLQTIWSSEISNPGEVPYTYDPERAIQELTAAGVDVANFDLVIDSVATWSVVAEAVAQMLRDIGINAQTRVWELGAMEAAVRAGDRQAVVHTWGNSSGSPLWVQSPNALSTGFTLWTANQEFWDLIDQAADSTDPDQRIALFRRVFDIHNEELPLITLALPRALDAARANVLHFEAHPTGRINMHRVSKVGW